MRFRGVTRRGWAIGPAVIAVALSGCGSPPDFPAEMPFAPRTDRLVLKVPDRQPAGGNEGGRLDEELAGLDALGGQTADPASLPAVPRQALNAYLAATFGTPAAPKIERADPVVSTLGLTPDRLAEGGRLYRRHCLQCHGLGGDGRGPTGLFIDPHPRDFRRGSFKFTSPGGGKPRRADLERTLAAGLKGTAMPAFALLPEGERDLMARYVTFLAVRGQVEFQTLAALAAGGADGVDGDAAEFAAQRLTAALSEWARAEAAPPPSPPPPGAAEREGADTEAAVRRGHALFADKAGAGCISCHEDFGRKAALRYDVWGTVVRPAALTAGVHKGGGRPEDLFERIRGGITPSGMPAHPALSESQAWDVVRFVRALPHPPELPPDVRAKVYPE